MRTHSAQSASAGISHGASVPSDAAAPGLPGDDWQLNTAEAVGPQIVDGLRQRIIRGELPAGKRLSEAEIGAWLAVSRQPVREAFIKLGEQGLVEIRPQRGTYVSRISEKAVMDARFVREAIEADVVSTLATRIAGQSVDPVVIDSLREQLAFQKQLSASDSRGFFELDERFHRMLAEAAGVPHAWQVLMGLKAQMDRVRYLSTLRFPMSKLVQQHTRIVDEVARGEAAAAAEAMRVHLREILDNLPTIAAENPDVFLVEQRRPTEQ